MINQAELNRGWDAARDIAAGNLGGDVGQQYVSKVALQIDACEKAINEYEGSKLGKEQLAGYVAEKWHGYSFNMNAAAAESANFATVVESKDHASVDVTTSFGQDYSLKYLKYADRSVKAQTKNVIQNYHEYFLNAKRNKIKEPLTLEEYLDKYDYSNEMPDLLQSVYNGQGRIIPGDQLDDGILKLKQMIATEQARGGENRLLNMKNYQETLEKLSDRIKDGNGVESLPLKKEEAEAIAEVCRKGNFKPEDFGLSLDRIVKREYILGQALKSGITAAVVTTAIQVVPEIYNLLMKSVEEEHISVEQLKRSGLQVLSTGTKSFILGYLACGLTIASKTNRLGAEMAELAPGVVGTVVALAFNMVVTSFDYAAGRINDQQYKAAVTRNALISGASIAGGSIATAAFPVANALSFMIGSVVGSVTASLAISLSEKAIISFCVDSGYTLFGLVKQDYVLPTEYFKNMGMSITDLTKVELDLIHQDVVRQSFIQQNKIEQKHIQVGSFKDSKASGNLIETTILRRGVIGFNRVGYV